LLARFARKLALLLRYTASIARTWPQTAERPPRISQPLCYAAAGHHPGTGQQPRAIRRTTIRRLVKWGQKDMKMAKGKKSALQQLADEEARKSFNRIAARQTIAEYGSTPEFEENHQRLRAERLAREAKDKEK
jgi:hypothetical protein